MRYNKPKKRNEIKLKEFLKKYEEKEAVHPSRKARR